MKKISLWIKNNLLFLCTLFLLAFIPLYPKIPLVDIKNTWVYIRGEDFVVLSVLFIWLIYLLRKKVTLKTPLTIPIFIFWILGGIATVHGIILIFPTIANVFPNVSFLSFIRHIEYFSLFFVAYSSIKDKNFLKTIIVVLIIAMLGVIFYGFGQRYLGFPAFLTMNEEFAKGIPIRLSELSRVPSTFAGHYDLAAYLVLIIPIFASLMFGIKNWLMRIFLGIVIVLGFVLLFMTVSRVSFFVLIMSLLVVVSFYKKKLVLISVPLLIAAGFLFATFQSSLFQRFGNTVQEANVLVNAETGEALAHIDYVERGYLDDKLIRLKNVYDPEELAQTLKGNIDDATRATPSALLNDDLFPEQIPLVMETKISTGESLPQGTGYINLSLSPVDRKLGNFFYELTPDETSTRGAEVVIVYGNFLVKKAAAYDLSFTTRFQGEWPNALKAFMRNVFLGSGYGSVSLAIDNNYLRMLGEIGLLGTLAFVGIFTAFGIYVKKTLPHVDSTLARSFVLGLIAGIFGLALNAILIDVFEASKVAFILWTLVGVTVGVLSFYKKSAIDMREEFIKVISSPIAVILYISALTFIVYSPMLNNFFVGDDFTWLRWAADCGNATCLSLFERIKDYFIISDGFFYRPGTKSYFLMMYNVFWLNQVVFHAVSLLLHAIFAILTYLISRKVLNSNGLAALVSIIFIFMSGYAEIVLWPSSTGHLVNAVMIMLSLWLYILWEEKRKLSFFVLALICIFLSTLFHELGVVAPLLIGVWKLIFSDNFKLKKLIKDYFYLTTFIPVVVYLVMRFMSSSHWSGGDYSYNLVKMPFNFIGNAFGYLILSLFGPLTISVYSEIRAIFNSNILLAVLAGAILIAVCFGGYKFVFKRLEMYEKKIILFCISFFLISLLPFLGLGNIASRYSYLATVGVLIIVVFVIGKLFSYLKIYGKDIAVGAMSVVLLIFVLLHIIQVQQLHSNWTTSGNMVERFFVSIDSIYKSYWNDKTELYFVNVPIKHGDAWVFPVGLDDAVWLTFRNENIKVNIYPDVKSAIQVAGMDLNKPVLLFENDGRVIEINRFRNRITGEIEYTKE